MTAKVPTRVAMAPATFIKVPTGEELAAMPDQQLEWLRDEADAMRGQAVLVHQLCVKAIWRRAARIAAVETRARGAAA